MSSCFEIEMAFSYVPEESGTPEKFDAYLDAVLSALESIGREADVTASLSAYEVTFTVETPDCTEDSLIDALSHVRAALHAAGGGTPGWPAAHEVLSTRGVRDGEAVPA